VGRMYEQRPSAPAGDAAWLWSIFGVGQPGWGRIKADGRAATLEDAKAQFATSWEAFKAADWDFKPPRSKCQTVISARI